MLSHTSTIEQLGTLHSMTKRAQSSQIISPGHQLRMVNQSLQLMALHGPWNSMALPVR